MLIHPQRTELTKIQIRPGRRMTLSFNSCLAIGMFCSAFTEDQIVSFLVTVFVLLALVLCGHPFVQTMMAPGSTLGSVLRAISPFTYFESIGRGVIDVRDLYYFGGVIVVFLYLNTVVIDLRRWR